jgi:cytochrome d ubiquinol oxidase subunit I
MVWTTLIGFTLLYGALMVVELFLLRRYVAAGPEGVMPHTTPTDPDSDGGGDGESDAPAPRPTTRRPTCWPSPTDRIT